MWDLGLRGLLVAGSTGEGPYLEPGEREQLCREARDAVRRGFVLCGVHAETVRLANRWVAEAEAGGADAVLVTTPTTLVRSRPDRIEQFFDDVIDDSPLPVLLYSVPKVTGVELQLESVDKLARLERVVGMKDSGGDPLRAADIVTAAGDGFHLMIGATRAISLGMSGGAHGAITASANYAARLVRDTTIAARRSVRAAAQLQARLTASAAAIEAFGVPGVKYAASRIGLAAGRSRAPLAALDPRARRTVRRSLEAADLA